MFATLFFGVLNPVTGQLYYINGGHEPLYVINSSGVKTMLKPTGPAVGMIPDTRFKIQQIDLEPGDMLVGYTDGVTEARSPEDELISINDSIEVIRWYQFQISVKPKRAVESASEEGRSESTDLLKDSDGSAKVALIGIDRSLSAWNVLLNRLTGDQYRIRHLIGLLENIRQRVETHFPRARAFVRPGFDTQRKDNDSA